MAETPQGRVLATRLIACLHTTARIHRTRHLPPFLSVLTESPSVFWGEARGADADNRALLRLLSVTPRVLRAMSERQSEFTHFKRIHVAVGTWNVNGGKQFRSNLLGTAELADWLLDSPGLAGVAEPQGKYGRLGQNKARIPGTRSAQGGLAFGVLAPAAKHRGLACQDT